MDDLRRLEAKGLARAKLRAKRQRASSIRRRTIRGSLALFAVAWVVVFGQLVSGNDPALSRSYKTTQGLAAAGHHRRSAAPVVPVESEPTTEPEPSFEPEPEVEAAPEVEAEPAPEPEPVITSSS